jgi:hypothetical protein
MIRLARLPRIYRLLRIARLFKVLRIFRRIALVNKLRDYMNFNIGAFRLIKFLIATLFLVHIVGCFWVLMASFDDYNPDTWISRVHMNDSDNFSVYLASIYWTFTTLLTVGYGDISAYTDMELAYASCWMLVGSIFYTFTIGNVVNVLTNLASKDALLQNKLATITEFCKEAKLSKPLRDQLKGAIEFNS